MKLYTDINQSKKLAEILPIESADCFWDYDEMQKFHRISWFEDGYNKESQLMLNENNVCAWSLAALLYVLDFPSLTQNKEDEWEVCVPNHKSDGYIEVSADNSVDACYEMIIKLHELKML